MLLNVKMPTFVGILTFMSMLYLMQIFSRTKQDFVDPKEMSYPVLCLERGIPAILPLMSLKNAPSAGLQAGP